jgi:hypothetical protein
MAIATTLLLLAGQASAALQRHNFTIKSSGSETGTGNFVWDDELYPNGSSLYGPSPGRFVSSTFTITGGHAGGGQTFNLVDCEGFSASPNFS